jgi:diaminohydroxyphosphoribosylaminopyrimidine deaminase/5-amino-6-(5-phosphoribosylamino)uracil reductase
MRGRDDIKFMQRCLDLAGKAEGMTYPNPLVGSVIVHDGMIIGEGYHIKAGTPHAEVNAINTVPDKKLLSDSILYVNLEPCSHFGSTPPCADLIIDTGIRKVVLGTKDTSSKVSGRGIKKLKDEGCEVITGLLENECRWINRRFFTFNEEGRPYIILKWAQSADGFLDYEREKDPDKKPAWITGEAERALVHKWRAGEQSILAGAGTIRADNPRLNVRDWAGSDPLRLILTGSGHLDGRSEVFKLNGTNIVFSHNAEAEFINSAVVKLDETGNPAAQISGYLFRRGLQSLIVEGGAGVLNLFLSAGLWDEARIFNGMENFKKGVKAPVADGKVVFQVKFSRSSLVIILNNESRFIPGIDNYNKYI